MLAWAQAIATDPSVVSSTPAAFMLPFEILAKAKLSKLVQSLVPVPLFGLRVVNEVTAMLEDHIEGNESSAVNDLQHFPSGLAWASYQARFGETASNQGGGSISGTTNTEFNDAGQTLTVTAYRPADTSNGAMYHGLRFD